MASRIDKFLQKFSSDKRFSLPYPFFWGVQFDGPSSKTISNVISKVNDLSFNVENANSWSDDGGPILVAQEVVMPSESNQMIPIGQDNRGGYMPGYGVVERTDFLSRNFSINFIETEKDIVSDFFTPWIVALSIDGLLNSSLKSNCTVFRYTRDNFINKKYTFKGVFPTNSEGYTLTYSDAEYIIKSVTFGYTSYNIRP